MILFLADVPLFNPASGAEQVLYQQAHGLSQKGFEICAITRVNGKSSKINVQLKNGIKEICYSADTGNTVRFLSQFLKNPKSIFEELIDNSNFDLVVCHQPFTLLSLLINKKLKKLPILYVFISPSHQEYLLINKNQFWPLKIANSFLRRMIERICLKKADKIMFLSDYMKQKAIHIYSVQHKCLILNPAGVDLERFKPLVNRNEIKKHLFPAQDKVHLLTVRNLERRMGLDNLLRAIHILRKNKVQVYLVLGGEGPEKNKLQNLIKKYDLSDDIRMIGFIPDEVLPRYYNSADFFILPTRKLEGFGLVTVESMACGTPVLGTPVGATKEILYPFNSQLLFADSSPEAMAYGIQEAINRHFNDQNEYEKLRLRCRDFAEKNYSWQRHIEKLLSIITETISSNNEYRN